MRKRDSPADDEILPLFRIAFCVSILLFFYGTFFPFHFDTSLPTIEAAWSATDWIPFWDSGRGRIESIPDIGSNILLTMPLGFFGFLLTERRARWQRCLLWGALGLALGCFVEVVQLLMPSRVMNPTDAFNNGLGALTGAVLGLVLRRPVSAFSSIVRCDGLRASSVLLFLVLVAYSIGPFDLTMDVSSIAAGVKALRSDPWEVGRPISHEWVQMVLFALFGSTVGCLARLRRSGLWLSPAGSVALALLLPACLEISQLFVQSHAPSLRDIGMGTLGSGIGLMAGLLRPGSVRPGAGLALLAIGIIASGLSPYRIVSWELRAGFEWIPLVEYYERTTPGALYEAAVGLLNFAVLAALFAATFRCSRWASVLAVTSCAAVIEFAQTMVAVRSAGTTDIVIAALGGWAGHTIGMALGRHGESPCRARPGEPTRAETTTA